jgi:hypothetical protein
VPLGCAHGPVSVSAPSWPRPLREIDISPRASTLTRTLSMGHGGVVKKRDRDHSKTRMPAGKSEEPSHSARQVPASVRSGDSGQPEATGKLEPGLAPGPACGLTTAWGKSDGGRVRTSAVCAEAATIQLPKFGPESAGPGPKLGHCTASESSGVGLGGPRPMPAVAAGWQGPPRAGGAACVCVCVRARARARV